MTLSIDELAEDKGLDPDFLRDLEVHENGQGLKIPYFQEDGSKASRHRLRTALSAGNGSRWTDGEGEILPYGLQRLDEAQDSGYLVMVEGETDTWTAWSCGLHALGLPGSSTTGKLDEKHVEGIRKIAIYQEPDSGGETFVEGMKERLREIGWSGELAVFSTGDGDLNDLYQSEGKRGVRAALKNTETEPFPDRSTDWPDPILPNDPEPAQEFPLEVLPEPARRYVEEKAQSLGTEETLVSPFVFGTIGMAIGASCEANIKSEWNVGTNTYLLLVTPSGVGKSPALKGATRPIMTRHGDLKERYKANLERYKQACDSEDEREPVEPPKSKAFVNDATVEALARDLENSPRGVVQIMDEASAWTRSMNKYREGDDREFFLRAWNRDAIETSRKSESEVSVESPHLSVLGAMVPSSLQHLTPPGENEDDGFLPRILFVYPEVSQTGMTFAEVTEETKRSYRRFIGTLSGLEPREKPIYDVYEGMVGEWDSNRVSLSTEARNRIQTWYNGEMVPQKEETDDPIIRSFISKLQDHVFRFALILQVSRSPDSEIIETENAERAIKLAEFFLDHFERTMAQISLEAEDGERDLKRYVLDRILDKLELLESHSPPSLPYVEIQQATKDKSDIQDSRHLQDLLRDLEEDHCLRINGTPGSGGDRCVVEVNPGIDPPESDSSYSSYSVNEGENTPYRSKRSKNQGGLSSDEESEATSSDFSVEEFSV